ncbi:MAG TPA: hypothetical protein VG325_05320 [Solirubrobacteraceae bacterium]|nr:hypothetical protein [Solirubrobacteraceae bacterium]
MRSPTPGRASRDPLAGIAGIGLGVTIALGMTIALGVIIALGVGAET